MQKVINIFLLIGGTLSCLVFQMSLARAGITLGQPEYGGSGCPAGTASATLSPDQTAISLLFDNYQINIGGNTGLNQNRKSCNIAIPVQIPNGYSVAIIGIDYRGFAYLPQGSYASFSAEYFWAGIKGSNYFVDTQNPYNGDFLLQDKLRAQSTIWSTCGQSIILRANTAIYANTNTKNDPAIVAIDSADVTAGLLYHLQWRKCDGCLEEPQIPVSCKDYAGSYGIPAGATAGQANWTRNSCTQEIRYTGGCYYP